jgi:ERF superfamily
MSVPLIYGKMIEAQRAFGEQGIAKSSKNTFQKFNYRSVDSTIAAANAIFSEVGIIAVPSVSDSVWLIREVPTSPDKVRIDFTLQANYTFTFYAEDGSYVCSSNIPAANTGQDDSKLAGQVLSYAYKEALFKTFSIPVEGTEDTDNLDPNRNQGATLPVATAPRVVSSTADNRSAQISAALKATGKTPAFAKTLLGTRKAADLSDTEFSDLLVEIAKI